MTNPFTKQDNEVLPIPSEGDTKAADAVGDVLKQAAAAASGAISTGMTGAFKVGTQAPLPEKTVSVPTNGYKTHAVGSLAGVAPVVTIRGCHYWSQEEVDKCPAAKDRAEKLVAVGRASRI